MTLWPSYSQVKDVPALENAVLLLQEAPNGAPWAAEHFARAMEGD